MRLQVGPTRSVKTLRDASRIAAAGTSIEVDAGDYVGDVAVWNNDSVTLRSVGGRARLIASGAAAEGKGIWVVRAKGMRIDGFDFEGATVPSRNGAGIRFDEGSLFVKDCRFLHNEMGLLTNNDPDSTLEVEGCEFAFNHRPDGHNHNLYVGSIAHLSVTGSYFHHARTGHLLKTRAARNHIFYNRLTDETGGTGSYELEFPNGGEAYVVGNLIAQDPRTENRQLISFGAEGFRFRHNALYLLNNTLVDPVPQGGVFLRVAPGGSTVRAINNLLVGPGALEAASPGEFRSNHNAHPSDFANPAQHDYRLRLGSRLAGIAVDRGQDTPPVLKQTREYVHPRSSRNLNGPATNPGAFQSMASRDGQ
jgi:hypothetical protein